MLTVSKAIMTTHGGDLWVTSSGVPGEGCVFGMELKAQMNPESKDFSEVSNSPRLTTTTTPTSGFSAPPLNQRLDTMLTRGDIDVLDSLHVLVVDDSPMNRKMLMLHLKGLGIVNITQACNGLEAVQAVEGRMRDADCDADGDDGSKMFDIIFMDCIMPVMDGIEATKKIRGLGYKGAIASVTGNGLPEDVREVLASGADRVLVKPVDSEKIASVVHGECCSCLHEIKSL
jgi:CheY-like chemotaxis protein